MKRRRRLDKSQLLCGDYSLFFAVLLSFCQLPLELSLALIASRCLFSLTLLAHRLRIFCLFKQSQLSLIFAQLLEFLSLLLLFVQFFNKCSGTFFAPLALLHAFASLDSQCYDLVPLGHVFNDKSLLLGDGLFVARVFNYCLLNWIDLHLQFYLELC